MIRKEENKVAEKSINKVVYGGETLIDLTADTVTPDKLVQGITAHDKSGAVITGTSTKDSDTSDATAAVAEILFGKTAYARGAKLTGTMPNNGGMVGSISTKNQEVSIPLGFHDGSGKVSIAQSEQEKIISQNIKQGVTLLGVEGTYSGKGVSLQGKTVTPAKTAQTVQPDEGYDGLSSVTVNAIPYTETENAAGGTTVTIAG